MDEKNKKHKYYVEHKEKWREYGRHWREQNPEKVKSIKAKYRASAKGRAVEKKYNAQYRKDHADEIRERDREYWAYHKEQKAAKDRRYRERHKEELSRKSREKYHAVRTKLNQALKNGKIKRGPCEVCGAEKAEAHHDNYNEPLKVRWLCKSCHTKWHRKHTPIRLN